MVANNLKMVDGLQSLLGALGDPLRDKAASAFYGMPFITDDQLLNSYRGSWLPRKIVNIPAFDSIRKWRDWQADQDAIEKIEAEEKRLNYRGKVLEARIKARLWGGAAIYIGTGDLDLMQPLDPERVRRGGVRYLTVLSRVELTAGDIDQDPISEFYQKPTKYTINGKDIHPSRFIVFQGAAHPEQRYAFGVTAGWSDSVLVSMFDAIRNADSVPANIASLVFEANVDVFGVPDFLDQLGDPQYEARMLARFGLVAANKGINRSILRDANETYERKQIAFSGLPDLIAGFLQIVSGAADIPITRLLGTSPGGLNSTGESDLRNYYDGVSASQELEMSPAMYRADECVIRSALGARPDDIHYIWSSLWQIDDETRAKIGKTIAETIKIVNDTGLFQPEAVAEVAANSFVEHSIFPGLEDAIEALPPIDFEAEAQAEAEREAAAAAARGQQTADARPMTLYIHRDVKNVEAIRAWAKSQGIPTVQDNLHVTIAFSKTPVDWIKVGAPWEAEMKIVAGGPRLMERFGSAIVLQFAAMELEWRHQRVLDVGGSSDYPEYQPHITIFWEMPGMEPIDIDQIEPYRGEIVLGPEIFEEVDENWRGKISQ